MQPDDTLPGDDFVPATFPYGDADAEKAGSLEKVAFPERDAPVPTFAAAYGDDERVPAPPPAHVPLGARVLGPRFFAAQPGAVPVSLPLSAVDPRIQRARGHLARQGSGSSQRSESSAAWSEESETPSMKGRRWVIE